MNKFRIYYDESEDSFSGSGNGRIKLWVGSSWIQRFGKSSINTKYIVLWMDKRYNRSLMIHS